MVKRTNDSRQLELVLLFPEPTTIAPTPTFPTPGTAVHFRQTDTSIIVIGPEGSLLGHVDPTQAPVLSRVLDRVFRDAITMELGKSDETFFEVVLHRRIDGDEPKKNVVRCYRTEPGEVRQAA